MSVLRIFLTIAVFAFGCTSVYGAEVTNANIQRLKPPITLEFVKSMFGDFEKGHGPYVWYRSLDDSDKEYWFWFLPQREGVAFEDLQVAFIAVVDEDDPDKLEIVWPKELSNKDKREVFNLFYK
jgi:hypothetical protein